MATIYLCIVVFLLCLLCLAVFDLFVGVSNDAVNFLQSAVGARVAKFRTVLIIASCGVLVGAVMSSGMMDVARHGIMNPSNFSFNEVMTIFLAVMVTDVIVLDVFNTLGMPTSTTVSLVFELLGAAFILATLKIIGDDSLHYIDLLNSEKALSVIIAIFVSVAIAFVFGIIVMWITRLVFTFNYKRHMRYSIAIFGGPSPSSAVSPSRRWLTSSSCKVWAPAPISPPRRTTISTTMSTCCWCTPSSVPPCSWRCSTCSG